MDQPIETETSESDLLRLAKRGDLDAFEQIVLRHERRVLALALRLTGSLEDSKDAMQETFIRLHRKIGSVDATRSVGPWLYTVTVNVCRDKARSHRRSPVVPISDHADRAADPSANPEGLASGRQQERYLREALQALPEKERAALLLREMEGLTTEEVARVLGSSAVTVRSQISMARVKLRKFFARRVGESR